MAKVLPDLADKDYVHLSICVDAVFPSDIMGDAPEVGTTFFCEYQRRKRVHSAAVTLVAYDKDANEFHTTIQLAPRSIRKDFQKLPEELSKLVQRTTTSLSVGEFQALVAGLDTTEGPFRARIRAKLIIKSSEEGAYLDLPIEVEEKGWQIRGLRIATKDDMDSIIVDARGAAEEREYHISVRTEADVEPGDAIITTSLQAVDELRQRFIESPIGD